VWVIGVVLLVVAAGDGWAGRPSEAAGADRAGPVIEAAVSSCGAGWTRPRAGRQTLRVRNSGSTVAEVMLIDAATGAVYAEVDGLAPGTTRSMRVTLGAGGYAFRCADDGAGDPVTGPRTRVAGSAPGGPAALPVTENDLYEPTRSYRAYVATGLDRLVARTDALRAAIDRGDLAAARAAWTPAHLAYERLGAAYGTFGDFDDKVNGLPGGLSGGVHDKKFTGFHRVEYGLWHGDAASSLRRPAGRLAGDVRALRAAFANERTDPADLPLRAHEILEDTVRFQLSGAADLGSGTPLRTAAANLEGTRKVIDVLRPLLRPRYPGLAAVDAWMDRLGVLLTEHASLDRLTRIQRERLNGTAGQLLELLAPVATICQPRRIA
jgi:iron uptake system component EfeO